MLGIFVVPAQAVHDTGLFQLDGNARTADNSTPSAREDWDVICKAHLTAATTRQIGTFCNKSPTATLPAITTISDRNTFIQDGINAGSDNIYKGGTDDADISSWLWKQAKPSPPKDDIQNAFAAQYTCTQARVTAGQCSSNYLGHKLIFFGGDRFANNGNTNVGFWFMRNAVGTSGTNTNTDGTCTSNSGCGFTGSHVAGNCSLPGHPTPCTPGDLFVFSAFLIGGAQPSISVYEWVGPGNATNSPTNANSLQLVPIPTTPGFSDNRCDQTGNVTLDQACAIVNQSQIPSPWLFQGAASGLAANTIDQFELFEGGLDLTALGFGDECISTFLLNSRSSGSSVNSVAQDFALGSMGGCTSSVVTTPRNGDNTGAPATSIGTGGSISVSDSAVVTVDGITNWSGNVSFSLCGPLTGATSNCSSGGTVINGTGGAHAAKAVNQSTAGGVVVSDAATVTAAGKYCWRATFTSSTTGVPNASDPDANGPNPTSQSECFTVNPVTPSLSTNSTNQTLGAAADFGSSIDDTATLSGTANEPGDPIINPTTPGGSAAGTITFTAYGPFAVDHVPASTDCTAAKLVYTSNVTVSGDNDYTASSGDGGSFTPSAPGLYLWVAQYGGDSPNTNAASDTACGSTTEQSFVQQIPTDVKTKQSWYPNDTATVTSTTSGTHLVAGGTVDFFLYDTATCTGNVKYAERITLTTTNQSEEVSTHNYPGATATAPPTYTWAAFRIDTDYSDAAASTAGPYSWKVVYTPAGTDTAHTGSSSSCTTDHTESFSITYTNDPGH